MKGLFDLLAYIGSVVGFIAILKAVSRLIAKSTNRSWQRPQNPVTFTTLARLARRVWSEDRTIVIIWVFSSLFLLTKYFGGWVDVTGYFFEFINLAGIVHFWVTFRLTDLTSESPRAEAPRQ